MRYPPHGIHWGITLTNDYTAQQTRSNVNVVLRSVHCVVLHYSTPTTTVIAAAVVMPATISVFAKH